MTRIVGLTGGIGCGKSTVAAMLRDLGAAIVDADVLAREAVEPGSEALAQIVERFGDRVVDERGALRRDVLGEIVFSDERARLDLNAIVHPKVGELFMARVSALTASGTPLIIYDVPLLFESGLDHALDVVIVVFVPKLIQIERLRARDELSDDAIHARIDSQMPLEEKARRATHVIDNSGSLEDTRAQVADLYTKLTGG